MAECQCRWVGESNCMRRRDFMATANVEDENSNRSRETAENSLKTMQEIGMKRCCSKRDQPVDSDLLLN